MKSEGKENIKRKKERMQSRRKRRKIDLTYLKRRIFMEIDKLFRRPRSIFIIFIYFIDLVFIYLIFIFFI